ncbi:MAG: SDR family oxidoreductase [Gammaproteobacteria bacterium]|nr:SDR family oxidoreductase [Gammaproteobacteria bacterium]MYD77317.1 SDR family oxidoreductase [Gammaproteobacteria bacterium]MYJ52516.1 SDR family oxidoreductase [Gammaproteobacteria bacterium]
MATVFICGASRGIGLELCRQYSARGERVIATCRSVSSELEATGAEIITGIDIADGAGVEALQRRLEGTHIDILIHNAGILSRETLEDMDFGMIERQFQVNTLGPLRVVHALLGNLGAGSKIGLLSSRMGSIADNQSGGRYGYRMSKAGLNAIGMSLARDLAGRGIPVVILHPGLVATEMTGGNGIAPTTAAGGIIERVDELTLERTGTFMHAEGYELPW